MATVTFLVVLTLIFCIKNLNSARVRYDDYRVYKVIPTNGDHVRLLKDLEEFSDSVIFLDGSIYSNKHADIIVSPENKESFEENLTKSGINYTLIDNNVQSKLDEENRIMTLRYQNEYNWKVYSSLENTYAWMKSLKEKYPEYITLLVGGKSYEGREILGVKLSYNPKNKGVFIEGGIHAREWISPATVTYILNQLLTSDDVNIRYVAENYNWYFFPHTNPDGYVYTHNTDRLWRKTRSNNGGCSGADPNRNWDFHWGEAGVSKNPCSEIFAGAKAFSEIETKTFSEFIATLKGQIQAYISFHSYSQLLLFPYGYTGKLAVNHKDLQQIGDTAAKALAKRHGTRYQVGNIHDIIYPASGSSLEWAYDVQNISLSYCYELRPASSRWNGFILPADQIIPTGDETLDSLIALLSEAKKLKYF